MKDKLTRCNKLGFQDNEVREYILDKLRYVEEKTNAEGYSSFLHEIEYRAFHSPEIQELVDKNKVYVEVPENFIRLFNVPREQWYANIPYESVICAVEKEFSAFCERHRIK